jgi:hypothetical protein
MFLKRYLAQARSNDALAADFLLNLIAYNLVRQLDRSVMPSIAEPIGV